jgi:hypothetical protein
MDDVLDVDVVDHSAVIACAYRCLRLDCQVI